MGFTPAKHNPSPSHLPPRYALTLYALGVLKVEEKIMSVAIFRETRRDVQVALGSEK